MFPCKDLHILFHSNSNMSSEKELLTELLKNYVEFDNDLYGVEDRVQWDLIDLALDFMSDYWVDLAWIKARAEEGGNIDLNNEAFGSASCWWDVISERADSQVDIYNADLREKAKDYSWFIEDAMREFGIDWCGIKERWLEWVFAMGQYEYYTRLGYNILNGIEKIIEDWDNVDLSTNEKENE